MISWDWWQRGGQTEPADDESDGEVAVRLITCVEPGPVVRRVAHVLGEWRRVDAHAGRLGIVATVAFHWPVGRDDDEPEPFRMEPDLVEVLHHVGFGVVVVPRA